MGDDDDFRVVFCDACVTYICCCCVDIVEGDLLVPRMMTWCVVVVVAV